MKLIAITKKEIKEIIGKGVCYCNKGSDLYAYAVEEHEIDCYLFCCNSATERIKWSFGNTREEAFSNIKSCSPSNLPNKNAGETIPSLNVGRGGVVTLIFPNS